MNIKTDIYGSKNSFGEELKGTKNITQSGHIMSLNERITSILTARNSLQKIASTYFSVDSNNNAKNLGQ